MTPAKKPGSFSEPAPTNPDAEPCGFCGARSGQQHGSACPAAAGWVERERAWRAEHE
jgi:hypothetical protein